MKKEVFDLEQVAKEMQSHWPKANCDHRAIAKKYLRLIQKALIRGIHMATEEQIKFNLIPIPIRELRSKLPRYGTQGNQKYWFDWLQQHHPLVQKIKEGYKIGNKGVLTMVKATREIELLLALDDPAEVFRAYYEDEVDSPMDFVPVDLASLGAYLNHNLDSQRYAANNDNHLATLKSNYKIAKLIFDIALYAKGMLPQIINNSEYGRKYYRGINLQNAPKVVRHAALGDCFQYDIEASVFVWKFDTAKDLDPSIKLPATLDYLDFKTHHRQRLANLLFENTSDYSTGTIKRAITAVGFGARTTNTVWRLENGTWQVSALKSIIHSNELIKKLFADQWFKEFVQEQDAMTKLIFDQVKNSERILSKPFLKTERGLLSKNKTMSYLYQQQESAIMQNLAKRLEVQGQEMLLLVHDGFYTKNRGDITDLRYELQRYIPHARLDEQRITAFKYNPDALIEEQDHKKFILEEEIRVAKLFDKAVHKPKKLVVERFQRNDEYDNGYDDGTKAYSDYDDGFYDEEDEDDSSY